MITLGDDGQTKMGVRVEQAGQNGGFRKIHNLGAGGDLCITADLFDLLALDQNDLIRGGLPGLRVEQLACPYRYDLWRWICLCA